MLSTQMLREEIGYPTIEEIVSMIEKYNERTGEHLTYGKFVARGLHLTETQKRELQKLKEADALKSKTSQNSKD